jgi:LmbE family N-acetylglucosaminyl deacetylase
MLFWTGFILFCGLLLQETHQATIPKRIDSPINASLPLPYHQWKGQKIMFIYPHVDDMEGTSGGLAAALNGIAEIHMLILTNGDKGCSNPEICASLSNEDLVTVRQQEQFDSAKLLGIPTENIYFLNYEDCQLNQYPKADLQRDIAGYIRKVQPNVVFTWDPQPRYELIPNQGWGDMGYHPDHQLSGQLTVDSIWSARLKRLWPDLGPAWEVEQLYFWTFTPLVMPTYYMDITGELYQKKLDSFLAMKSQYDGEQGVKVFLNLFTSRVAHTVGLPKGHHAEAFTYVLW